MRYLTLLRHAKADWSGPALSDQERSLSARGRDAAPRIGAYLAKNMPPPDCVLVSTARRTRETWALAGGAFAKQPRTLFDERLYCASPQTILDVIADLAPACHSLLVVAHNPGLHELAGWLAQSGNEEALGRLAEKFPTAGLARIELPVNDWSMLQPGIGRLVSFVTPRLLDSADA